MAQGRTARSARRRGGIDRLPSGALRVRVYAGVDPVTKRRHDFIEMIAPGPQAERKARAARDRLVGQVAERRNPRTSATVDQLLDRYLDQFDGAPNALTLYRGYVRNHISPFLGHLKVGQLDAEALDSFYAELRRCRKHCSGMRATDHRTTSPHECDDRCGRHRCKPLSPTAVRHMHFILSGAYKRAVRWRWVSVSPIGQAEPPAAPKPNPAGLGNFAPSGAPRDGLRVDREARVSRPGCGWAERAELLKDINAAAVNRTAGAPASLVELTQRPAGVVLSRQLLEAARDGRPYDHPSKPHPDDAEASCLLDAWKALAAFLSRTLDMP